jgi:N-acetylglucosaminyldiphosphoundecaprenol N-acetyl-beta-D-mannosaminyltransferase
MMSASEKVVSNKSKGVVHILGLPVTPLTMEELLLQADRCIASRGQMLLGVVNAAKVVNARRNPYLRQSLKRADIIVADGAPIVWLSRLMGTSIPERVAGIDIMYRLLERSCEKNYSVYFLGAEPDVVKKVVELVRSNFHGLRIAGFRDGYFDTSEEKQIAEDIRNSGADILFVAISSPRKEAFLEKWHHFMLVPVCHGVGGSFDVLAGVTKRAPLWMQGCGLEWLYRVIQEPRRLWKRYLVTNIIFITISLEAVVRARCCRLFRRFESQKCSNPALSEKI